MQAHGAVPARVRELPQGRGRDLREARYELGQSRGLTGADPQQAKQDMEEADVDKGRSQEQD